MMGSRMGFVLRYALRNDYDALEWYPRFAVLLHRLDVSGRSHARTAPHHLSASCAYTQTSHNSFTECDLWTPGRAGNAILALHSLNVNIKVEFTHSQYDSLTQYHHRCHLALRMQTRTSLLSWSMWTGSLLYGTG